MAPKALSHSRQPSKEREEKEEPSSEEEETEADSSEEEKGNFSDEEEEEGSSEDEEEEEDQEKVKINKTPSPVPKFGSKSILQENGSDSDPDSEGSPSDYKLQPISKSSVVSAKRAHQEGDSSQQSLRSSKKPRTEEKKSSSTPGGGVGFGGITRLWSNDDEIALLNGMVDFRNVKGLDPNADMGAFYDFVKGKLQVDFSRDQLRTKISRMKKRFLNALKKGGNGLDPVFSKPHEDMVFELSKKIWGGAVGNSEGSKNGDNAKKGILKAEKIGVDEKEIVKKEKDVGEQDFWSKYRFLNESFHNMEGNFPSLAMSETGMSLVKERLSLIGNAKAKELNDKWKQLIMAETELNYKMLALMTEQVKMAFGQ